MSPIVLAGDDPEVNEGKPAPDPYLVCYFEFLIIGNPQKNLSAKIFADISAKFFPKNC